MTEKKMSKQELILNCAIEILKNKGDAALSMRQVSVCAKMRLSNVQYYFKDKDALLVALGDHYFNECLALLKEYASKPKTGNSKQQLKELIDFFLDHVEELSDMCCMFRELWAISTRNNAVNTLLMNYYQQFSTYLVEILMPISGNRHVAEKQASIILPFVEGYSIVNKTLPSNRYEIADSLNKFCFMVIENQDDI